MSTFINAITEITIQQLPHSDLGRVKEIDRSEEIEMVYTFTDGQLIGRPLPHHAPTFTDEMWEELLVHWREGLADDGVFIGAIDGEKLAGFTILRLRLQGTMAQLMALYISRPYRRMGVAQRLFDELQARAIASGASALYVSATESDSAVGFYLKQGFRPTRNPHPELFALEPDDIHMIKQFEEGQ